MIKEDLVYDRKPDGYNYLIETVGSNAYIALREVRWNPDSDYKLDIRRYFMKSDGIETPSRGISLSEEGANTLAESLIELGYGDIDKILQSISERECFPSSLAQLMRDSEQLVGDLRTELEKDEANKPLNAKELLDQLL